MADSLPITALRLRERMDEVGASQDDLADNVGCTQGAISQILTGMTRNSRFLPKIAESLAINLAWLAGVSDEKIDMFTDDGEDLSEDGLAAIRAGTSSRRLGKPEQMTAKDRRSSYSAQPPGGGSDTVELHQFDLAYGLGASFIHDTPVTGQRLTFSRSWIRHFTDAPFDQLFFARGIGDSMMPTIHNDDILLIDTSQQTPRMWDKIWALEMGGMGMVKRLRPTKDGAGIRLLSDAGLPEEVAFDGEMNVIGRVVAVMRRI